ncbi:MAG: hypothetical protein IJ110_01430 [Lachnospiraceae bacterium]|nr:hypothetical protein [Lachnospiraceae bacterium]
MADLATAYVQIIPSAEGIEGKLTEALGGASESAGASAGAKMGNGMLGGIGSALAGGAVAVGTAAAGLTAAFTSGASEVAAYGDHIDKMSQKIGISAESYQQWDYVMSRAGTSVDNLKAGMMTLSTQAEKNSDAFQQLGISEEEVANLSQEELFERVVFGLSEMEAGSERSALAAELLGKAGKDMAPLFNEGTDAIQEQLQMASDYGMVMSDDLVAAAATWEDSLTTMQGTMNGLKNNIMGEFLPSMSSVMDGLSLVFAGDSSGMQLVQQGISDFMGKIAEVLPDILSFGAELITSLAGAIIENLPTLIQAGTDLIIQLAGALVDALPDIAAAGVEVIVTLVSSLGEAMPDLIPAIVDAVLLIGQTLIDNIPSLIGAAITLFLGIVEGLIAAIPDIVAALPQMISSIVEALIGAIPQLIDAGIQLFVALVQNTPAIIAGIIEAIPLIISGIVGAFTDSGPQITESGVQLITLLGEGMLSLGSWVSEQAVALLQTIIDGFLSMPEQLAGVGKSIVDGLWGGLQGAWGLVTDGLGGLASSAVGGLKNLLGIGSPSKVFRDEVGRWIPAGIAEGIETGIPALYDAMDDMENAALGMSTDMAINTRLRASSDPLADSLLSELREMRTEGSNMAVNVYLQGDARNIWKVVRTENTRRMKATNYNALAAQGG